MRAMIHAAGLLSTSSRGFDPSAAVISEILVWLRDAGVHEVIIGLHGPPERLTTSLGFGDGHNLQLSYALFTPPRGSGGTLRRLAHIFDQTVAVIIPGSVPHFDLRELLAWHLRHEARVTIALQRTDRTGVSATPEPSWRGLPAIQGIAGASFRPAGVYLCEPDVPEYVARDIDDLEHDVLPRMVAAEARVYGRLVTRASHRYDLIPPPHHGQTGYPA